MRRYNFPMKLFSRFFRTAPPSPPTPEERIAALSAGSAELILGAALGADESGLRVAAIRRLPDGDALRRIAGLSVLADGSSIAIPAALERAAQTRIAELIDEGSLDFAELRNQTENRTAVLCVSALCKDPNRLPQALASIDDPRQLEQLVVES